MESESLTNFRSNPIKFTKLYVRDSLFVAMEFDHIRDEVDPIMLVVKKQIKVARCKCGWCSLPTNNRRYLSVMFYHHIEPIVSEKERLVSRLAKEVDEYIKERGVERFLNNVELGEAVDEANKFSFVNSSKVDIKKISKAVTTKMIAENKLPLFYSYAAHSAEMLESFLNRNGFPEPLQTYLTGDRAYVRNISFVGHAEKK